MDTKSEYEKMKKDLAIEEGESWIHAYPDKPVDNEGNPISDKTTKELGVYEFAGGESGKKIEKIDSLQERMGGEEKDWVKLSSPSREGIQAHGFKNLESGTVSMNREPADVEQRRQADIERNKLEKAEQFQNNNPNDLTMETKTTKESLAEGFSENKPDIVDEAEPIEKSHTDTSAESETDIVDEAEPAPNRLSDFDENAESMNVDIAETPTETLERKYDENAGDITESTADTSGEPGNFSPDYKP